MKVNEIFHSIDGEGLRAGELATFIRLAGCNLRCSYCDTAYALTANDGEEKSIEDIISIVKKIGYKNITLTGGEPLIHKDVKTLVERLTKAGFYVNIETNGSVDISDFLMKNVLITCDFKTNSSGCSDKMILENINNLRESDVLKFVMGKNDKEQVKEILVKMNPKCYIYLSPIFGEIEPCELVEFQKECFKSGIDTSKLRVQLQLHKYIWDPNKKGV